MSVPLDIKQDLRDRIQRLINLGPIVSYNILTQQDMIVNHIDRTSLTTIMDSFTNEYRQRGFALTYDLTDGCQVTLYNSQLSCNSPGGQCAIDFSMRRFKRGYTGPYSSYITVTPTSPAIDMF